MLRPADLARCQDAQVISETLHTARALERKAELLTPHQDAVGDDSQWLFPASKWTQLADDAQARLYADFLPQTASKTLAVPAALLLSQVFAIGRHAREVKRRLSFRYGKAAVSFVGEELRQFDARVLFALYSLARYAPVGEPVSFHPIDLLRSMKKPTSGPYFTELELSIERLQQALIRVEYSKDDTKDRKSFQVQLLGKRQWRSNDPRGKWLVHIDRDVLALFRAGYGRVPLEKRMALPDGITSALAGVFIAVGQPAMKFKVDWLRETVGSAASNKKFRQNLREACDGMHEVGLLRSYKLGTDSVTVKMVL